MALSSGNGIARAFCERDGYEDSELNQREGNARSPSRRKVVEDVFMDALPSSGAQLDISGQGCTRACLAPSHALRFGHEFGD